MFSKIDEIVANHYYRGDLQGVSNSEIQLTHFSCKTQRYTSRLLMLRDDPNVIKQLHDNFKLAVQILSGIARLS